MGKKLFREMTELVTDDEIEEDSKKREKRPRHGGAFLAETAASLQVGQTMETLQSQQKEIEELKLTVSELNIELGRLKYIPIDSIRIDPTNLRFLGWSKLITYDEILNRTVSGDDPNFDDKVQFIKEIYELAKSIKNTNDIKMAISTYLEDESQNVYNLIDGERRYWACRINNIKEIPASIEVGKPKNNKAIQFQLNDQRTSISAYAEIIGLQMVIDEATENGEIINTVKSLTELIGRDRGYVSDWWILLSPKRKYSIDNILNGLKNKTIRTKKIAAIIAKIEDQSVQKKVIKQCIGYNEKRVEKVVNDILAPNEELPIKNKNDYKIKIKAITDPNVAKEILLRLDPTLTVAQLDLDDPLSISEMFDNTINKLVNEFGSK